MPRAGGERAGDVLSLPYDAHFDALYVVDHPGRVEFLTRDLVARLGPEEELRRLAINNTVQRELMTVDIRDHAVTATATVRLVAKDGSPYVPTGLMVLHRYFAGPAPHGALVSVPRYSMLLLHEVTSPAALDFINVFHDMTASMYDSAPDRCAAQVFWWAAGNLHAVQVAATDDPERRRVVLPAELEPVVERLRAG
jgi:hypothetical protein